MNHMDMIQSSLDYIEDHLKTTITPEELSRMAGYSLFHFYRLFQNTVGMPVMGYITRRRLLWAAYEMARGRKQIDAALMYGFDTAAGFYKAFRREFGCSPTEFGKRFRIRKPYRIQLLQEEYFMLTHKKVRQVLTHWDLQEAPIRNANHASTGNISENTFYIGEEYVLKVYAAPGRLQTSAEILMALHEAGLSQSAPIPTAKGEAYAADGELYYLLTRRIEGDAIRAEELYRDPALAGCVGQVIGSLHRVLKENDGIPCNQRDIFEEVRDNWLEDTCRALGIPESFREVYIGTFGPLSDRLPRQIIHRDPNPSNILMKDGKLTGFVDFELSQRSIRIFDPCYAATAVLSETFDREDKEQWFSVYREIIRGYDSTAHLTREEKQALPYVVLSIQLICTGWFRTQEKYRELALTNEAMLCWLLHNREKLCY